MYVVPFCMGPLDAESPMLGVEITDSEYVVVSMRVMTRIGTAALELINDGGRWVRALHSVGAPLAPGPAGRGVAVQRHQVHHPVPGGADDLVVRLRLRRKRPAGQEVLLAADRLGAGPGRGLAGRAHAHPQADRPGRSGAVRRGRVPECLRQDESRHARADDPGLEGGDARRRHRLDDVRLGRPAATRSIPSTGCSASLPEPAGRRTRTRCAPSRRATRSSPTWR